MSRRLNTIKLQLSLYRAQPLFVIVIGWKEVLSVKVIIRLNNKGALKRGLIGVMLIAVMLGVLMAHYALSGDVEGSIYRPLH